MLQSDRRARTPSTPQTDVARPFQNIQSEGLSTLFQTLSVQAADVVQRSSPEGSLVHVLDDHHLRPPQGSGYHPESSGQVERFNQLLEQTLRCTVYQMAESRKWTDLLPIVEFAVNNTPNRMTGYTAFYLNYGYHPLHTLQLFDSAGETKNEFVMSFTSRLQDSFWTAMEQLYRAQEQMKKNAGQHRKVVDYAMDAAVLLNTRYLRFKNCPRKLQRQFMGPFQIKRKISSVAYELDLPASWSVHPVSHSSLLKPWWESDKSSRSTHLLQTWKSHKKQSTRWNEY